MNQEELLKSFINRVLHLQDQEDSKHTLSQEDLKAVAMDLGLDEEDWQTIQLEFQRHVERGLGFKKFSNWEDAIAEFQQALMLNPTDPQCLEEISQAYYASFKSSGKESEKEKAVTFARRLLDHDPSHEPSLRLISEAKKPVGRTFSSPIQQKRKNSVIYLTSMLVGAVIFSTSIIWWNAQNKMMPEKNESQKTDVVPAPQSSTTENKRQVPASKEEVNQQLEQAEGDVLFGQESFLNIPIRFRRNAQSRGIELEPIHSAMSIYSNSSTPSFSYKAAGYLNFKGVSVKKIEAKFSLLDEEGYVMAEKIKELKAGYKPATRGGDKTTWDLLMFEKKELPKEVALVQVEIKSAEATNEFDTYPPTKLISNIQWDEGKPKGHELLFRERTFNLDKSNTFVKQKYARLGVEVENTGSATYESVKVLLEWQGEDDSDESETYIVSGSYPFFKPGMKLVFGGTYQMSEKTAASFKGYKIHIISWK
ncbi:MAG: hypothetical protein AAFY71_12500 [Bacteroidota bacterium]